MQGDVKIPELTACSTYSNNGNYTSVHGVRISYFLLVKTFLRVRWLIESLAVTDVIRSSETLVF